MWNRNIFAKTSACICFCKNIPVPHAESMCSRSLSVNAGQQACLTGLAMNDMQVSKLDSRPLNI
tara:strand:- start:489 stop:680 length:192 start_codon:yes stop_codon:yes gene_type:complete